MLEGLAAWVLNTYVGAYVENLNTAQLSIALLQGAVELENLPLKKDALRSLDIPIEVKSGFIGKITLQIPLRRMRSEPWVISIEKLYLVAGPLSRLNYDLEKEKKYEQEQKKVMLDTLEEKWQIFQGVQQDASSSSSWFSYGTSMAANILENIQLNVKDVHIRYEDDKMNPSCPFACGIVIKNLSIQSTDASWTPKFVSHYDANDMFKLVDLTDFGIYCDSNVTMVGDLSMYDLADALERDMYLSTSGKFEAHKYILQPITAQGKVRRNMSALPLRSAGMPRISVELTLGDISLSLATDQYHGLNLWQREFTRHGLRRKHRRWRPAESVISSPRMWWLFAQKSHLHIIEERNKRLTKTFLVDRAKSIATYVKVYSVYLSGEALSAQQKASKSAIEEQLSFDELKIIRKAVSFKVTKTNQMASTATPKKSSQPSDIPSPSVKESGSLFQRWFPGWSGWSQTTSAASVPTPQQQCLQLLPTSSLIDAQDVSLSSSSSSNISKSHEDFAVDAQEDILTEHEIEQEIKDVIKDSSVNSSFLRKDTVFARMTFMLKKGSFQLKESNQIDKDTFSSSPLVELQCSSIGMEFESRPRTSAMKFSLAVGNFSVLDQTAKDSVFAHVICPQAKDLQCKATFKPISQLTNIQNIGLMGRDTENMEFFKLVYEKNPHGFFKYSINMRSQSLDIIYAPELIHRIKDLFSSPASGVSRTSSSVSTGQFEKFRKQTQEDLKNTLDQLLEGKASRWNINLDISAPRFVIPDSMSEQNPQLVVIDLGNFRFNTITPANEQDKKGSTSNEEDGEDKFETPLSTPPNEADDDESIKKALSSAPQAELKKPKSSDSVSEVSTENVFQDRLYEKYRIGLTEVQVLMGKLTDNWRHAYARGTSLMHVVDRFNISVQLDRRLIITSDVKWPTARISGNLPSLTFHLNERKIQGLQKCLDKFSEPKTTGWSQSSLIQKSSGFSFDSNLGSASQEHTDFDHYGPTSGSMKDLHEDNKIVALQFLINSLSLEIQSQGQALIELQVTGVKADVMTKPLNTSLVLTVHSLLLVDALQTYGPDFELLVASHKNVIEKFLQSKVVHNWVGKFSQGLSQIADEARPGCPVQIVTEASVQLVGRLFKLTGELDSRSGSIKGSEFNSPVSPMSPSSPVSPGSPVPELSTAISFSSFQSIQDAISNAFHSVMPHALTSLEREPAMEHSSVPPAEPSSDTKALILLEYEVVTTPSGCHHDNPAGDTSTRILNLHFNSLDFIANQETLVEIMGFFNRTFPKKTASESEHKPIVNSGVPSNALVKKKDNIHISADFKRLNVMLVRFLSNDGHKAARKVATATMSSAKLQAVFDESWEVEGSLGGLHLLDVTPEGTLYQQVVSIGQFQEVDAATGSIKFGVPTSPSPDMYQTAASERVFSESYISACHDGKNACTFVLRTQQHQKQMQEVSGSVLDLSRGEPELIEAKFDMAALTYIHCPKFLDELVDCVSEFRDYVTKVASSIKTAATEVAMGMVGVRGEKDGPPAADASSAGYAIRRDHSLGDITHTILLEDSSWAQQANPAAEANKCCIIISARMESPILVIPRTPNSPQVLIAHLGEIVIDNSSMQNDPSECGRGQFRGQNQELINLSLTKMNLYSLHLDQQMSLTSTGLSSSKLSELTQKFGLPILYDTSMYLAIGKRELDTPFINPNVSSPHEGMMGFGGPSAHKSKSQQDESDEGYHLRQVSSLLDIKAEISSPLKLSLSKEVYEQILQTMDNLTYDGDFYRQHSHKSHHTASGASSAQGGAYSPKTHPNLTTHIDESSAGRPTSTHDDPNILGTGGQASHAGEDNFLAKHLEFYVPIFEVELCGDFGEGEQGLVDLKLYDFSMQYEKNDRISTHINLHLKSLQMDDLLEPVNSKHRQIIISRPSQSKDILQRLHSQPKVLMSKSCPDSTIITPVPKMPPSLPVSFVDSGQSYHYESQQQHQQHKSTPSSQRRRQSKSPGDCPYTPPPSPAARDLNEAQQRRSDDLVHIDITLVDKKRPEFVTKYNKTNRFINIDFACLDATINLQTWVVLLDFLGLGAKVHDMDASQSGPREATQEETNKSVQEDKEDVNSDINFQVESFTLIFNKPDYQLAQATAANLRMHMTLRDGNLTASGQLGSLSLLDQSPHGQLYRQRFVSTGRQVVEFHFFKYGLPDFALLREFDISLKLRMSSIRYIHTNRFQAEMVAFAQHFLQLQAVLGRMRAASAGKKINETATRGSRILLDIEAASPILLIPHSSLTHAVLVADLGNLKLNNKFIVDGETGTLRAERTKDMEAKAASQQSNADTTLLQKGIVHRVMTESQFSESFPSTRPIDPMAQSVYGSIDRDLRLDGLDSAGLEMRNIHPRGAGWAGMKKHASDSYLMSKTGTRDFAKRHDSVPEEEATVGSDEEESHLCLLDVISVTLSDMDLFTARHVSKSDYKGGDLSTDMEFSTFVIEREHGRLLKEKCLLELHIERNLEGDVSHSAPDFSIKGKLSSVDCRLDVGQYELVRGILNHNLGERLEEFQRPLMSHLQDPKIQTVLSGKTWKCISLIIDLRNVTVELLHAHPMGPSVPERSLSRLDFIRSQLSFSGFSNQLKEVDLVSNEIRIYDTRFKNEPVNSRPNVFTSILQPSRDSKEHKGLQMEMHLRSAPDSTQFTVLLNNMRLMCVFDFLLAMREFLMKEPPDPFAKVAPVGQQTLHTQHPYFPEPIAGPFSMKSFRNVSPLTVSRGIATKRGPMVEEVKVLFELVLNFTDTQFVVVEDSTSLDTNAVILKNTAVIIYKPQAQDKVLSCSLQSVELFSCCLMAEDDTALSIIDPTTINIELNANPLPQPNPHSSGLLGLRDAQRRQLVLEVLLKTLNIRVSYHDMVMFLAIVNSLPQQALQAKQQHQPQSTAASTSATTTPVTIASSSLSSSTTGQAGNGVQDNITKSMLGLGGISLPCVTRKEDTDEEVQHLLGMGFPETDVRRALAACSWDVNEAALFLTQSSKVTSLPVSEAQTFQNGQEFMLTSVELNADNITLSLIDDCGDADIPLAEISCSALSINQELEPSIEGKASFQMMAEYYNRKLSGWEPFLEPWKCLAEWKQYSKPEKKLAIGIAASEVLNINITSALIDLYKQTSGNWTEDYHTKHRDEARRVRPGAMSGGFNQSESQSQHKRSPFIPYVIRNDTGSNLWFQTATTTPSNLAGDGHSSQAIDLAYIHASDWKRVSPGESRPFHFHRREKLRHQKSHAMHVNQLLVTVEGWLRLSPVSVDKVGVYFRHAEPELKAPPHVFPARTVFEVLQEGSARKLIVVRSALVVDNRLDSPVELKLEATDESGHYQCMTIPQNTSLPIPLSCINMRMRARPSDWPVHFCGKPLDWQHVKKSGEKPDGIRTCEAIGSDEGMYRFFVCVTRQKFPEEGTVSMGSSVQQNYGVIHPTLPGHVLTLLPTVTISNLLPLELHYYLKGTGVSGNLKAGKESALHGVDVSQNFDLGIHLENFPQCRELTIPPNTNNRKVLLRIFDSSKRMLKLVVRINMIKGGSIRLTISAQFWLVNKSGLPLVFKQDGSKTTAAGQFEEHEQARSVTPLLFSFSDADEFNLCQMRVGTSVHGPTCRPQWSSRFSLEGGTSKRALHVVHNEGNRPDWVYNIGIQVSPGRGRYRGTNIVTFAPRFVLDNQSDFKLAIVQHYMIKKEASQQVYLTALPQCSLPFHWPRGDLDQLLSVKLLNVEHCRWSGGFSIDKINSFHINMRESTGKCHLLKVEVVQQGPTFFTVFANADVMPPPFRIDNFSDVPVQFYQTHTTDDRMKAFIQPQTSVPYAWDEPTLNPLKLTLAIVGGTSASYSLDKLEEGEQLHYENFIYLAASATFDRNWNGPNPELVLDCVHNSNIVFMRKEKGKRNQLWRMTGSGMLEHEGSRSPRDLRNPGPNSDPGLVLDIADLAPRPGQSVPLILRKPDMRRKSTQTWRFTQQGQLCCQAGFMCVQAVGGTKGLQEGAIAILGPGLDPEAEQETASEKTILAIGTGQSSQQQMPIKSAAAMPSHMLISRQKLRPGSGCVSVRVSMDGPIRVIELVDIQQRQVVKRMTMEEDLEDWEVYDEIKGSRIIKHNPSVSQVTNIELSVTLKDGIGVSLVNSLSEELLYITLKNISVEVVSKPSSITFDASISHIQADNQIWGAQRPVLLFVTPMSRRDVLDNTPALHFSAHKVPSAKWKAEIFKHLYVSTKRMTLHIEEQLLWKLMQLAGVGRDDRTLNRLDEMFDAHRALSAVTSIQSTRYYFGSVRLSVNRVTLSMVTTSKLPPDLKAIKNAFAMSMIAFEQANIDMRSFEKYHMFETGPFLINEIMNHYREELIGQAAKILGSVDFLGNPLGLVHDITEGIAGFVKDGNVGGLLKNVTHGVSNSTAKVVSSLSDGISTVGLDEQHNLRREALRNVTSGSSTDHLMAGFKGLGHGILGGVTSLVSQSISGVQNEGIFGGLIKGVAKGMIGTVTKPVSGVLDLTSGLANAVRDSSTRTSHRGPNRIRSPRCTQGPSGLLPLYMKSQAEAQTVLYDLNEHDYSEYLITMEQLISDPNGEGNLHVLISSRQVLFLNQRLAKADNIVLLISHAEIMDCKNIVADGKYYLELTRKINSNSDVASTSLTKPRVRCDKQNIAKKVAQEIKYAKNLYDEKAQTLEEIDSSDEEDF